MRAHGNFFGGNSIVTGDSSFEPAPGEGYCTHIYEIDLKVNFDGSTVEIESLECKKIKKCTEEILQDCNRIKVTTEGCGSGSQEGTTPTSEGLCKTVKKLLNEEEITDLGEVLFVLTESIGLVKDSEEDDLSGIRDCLGELCAGFAEGEPVAGERKFNLNIRCCEVKGTCNPSRPRGCDDEEKIDLYLESENLGITVAWMSWEVDLSDKLPLEVSVQGGNFCCYLGCPKVSITLGEKRGGSCNVTRFLDHPDCVNLPNDKDNPQRAQCALGKAVECWSQQQSGCADQNCP